jgi:UDP-glucose 4-epimerase
MVDVDGQHSSERAMRVLVTGGAGFIGANLVRLLAAGGHVVTVLDDLSAGRSEYLAELGLDFVNADILDAERVQRAIAGHEAVVHLAAQTGVPASIADPRGDCQVNVIGTLNVLEAARLAGVRRIVFASSNAPLGRQSPPATEVKVPLPVSPYGASKLAGEAYCLAYHGSFGLETVALRFANVYGPFSAHKRSVIAKFMQAAKTGRHVVIDGDGTQTRDFVYVADLCGAIDLALHVETCGEIFQIATGVETSIAQLVTVIQSVAGRGMRVSYGPSRQGDVKRNYSEIQKAQRVLSWQPIVPLIEGLQETWKWFRDWRVSESGAHDSATGRLS